MNKSVFCYHEFFGNPDTAALIALWERNWRYYGWETHILTAERAMEHPLHNQLVECVSKWPTKATVPFNIAAARRWCAMVMVGGGMQSDADIMNYGFTPSDAQRHSIERHGVDLPPVIMMFDDLAAGPAFGDWKAFEDVVKYWIALDVAKYPDQCCEMTTMRGYPSKRIPLAPEMTLKDWQTAPMVHYGNGRWNMAYPGVQRSVGIPTIRPLLLAP